MSNKDILEKAIQKAIDGGFNPGAAVTTIDLSTGLSNYQTPQEVFTRNMLQDLIFRRCILFTHEFAKALWDDSDHEEWIDQDGGWFDCGNCGHQGSYTADKCFEFQLQQMVIAENPIKYLGEHIDD